MGKIRRGNFVFLYWIGDHSPPHVHIYKDRKRIVKWDTENWRPMTGKPTRQILKHLRDLREEGLI